MNFLLTCNFCKFSEYVKTIEKLWKNNNIHESGIKWFY